VKVFKNCFPAKFLRLHLLQKPAPVSTKACESIFTALCKLFRFCELTFQARWAIVEPKENAESQRHAPRNRPFWFDGRVLKAYHGANAKERFENEVRVLKFLEARGCNFVPRLLAADERSENRHDELRLARGASG